MWIVGSKLIKHLEQRIELDEQALYLEQDIEKSRKLMESMVDGAVTEWSLYNLRSEEEMRMTPDKRDKCLAWVIERVIENSTPSIITQIQIGYPAQTREQYINSIKNVALPYIIRLTVLQNTKNMDDNIPNINLI